MTRIGHKFQGLLFDKDGTLFDFNASWGVWARSAIDQISDQPDIRAALADRFCFDYQAAKFRPESPIIAGTSNEIFDAIATVLPDLSREEITKRTRESLARAKMVPVCPLKELFTGLREQGYILGIATNDEEGSAKQQLDDFDLLDLFDFVAGSDSGWGAKPQASMCSGFAQSQNLDPSLCLMIGDSTHDLHAGQAAGMPTMGVLTGTATREDLHQADWVLTSIAELPSFLKAIP